MRNDILKLSSEDLLGLALKSVSAAALHGAAIQLSPRRSTENLKGLRDAADKAEKDFQKGISALVPLRTAFKQARTDARMHLTACRDVLKRQCGSQYCQAWNEAGWKGSLAIPRSLNGMLSTVSALEQYFKDHADHGVAQLGVTSAQSKAVFDALDGAKNAASNQEVTNKGLHAARDAAFEALRNGLRGLCNELSELIGDEDARWKAFGLNAPGEPSVPPAPTEVAVENDIPCQLVVTCAAVPFADYYRFFTQPAGSNAEPQPVGSSGEPVLVIEGLAPGASWKILVSAVNTAGSEGPRSDAVATTVLAAEAA